jgi:hypothetical protein
MKNSKNIKSQINMFDNNDIFTANASLQNDDK